MRHSVAVAALALAPLAAPAQASAQIIDQYTFSGCVNGVTRFDPAPGFGTYVQGPLGCFGGSAILSLVPIGAPGDPLLLRLDGTLTATFDPGFTATSVRLTDSDFGYRYGGPNCAGTCTGGGSFITGRAITVGAPVTLSFQSGFLGTAPPVDVTTLRVAGGALFMEYRLPGAPAGDNFSVRADLTFTSIPEPTTAVLTASGLFAVAGAGWRRRPRRV
jgi:hypothetical protein